MHKLIAIAAALTFFACSEKQPTPEPDLQASPQLAVFHTERGVYVVPVAVGATSWKSESARIESDADDDGIPASLDENEVPAGCAAAVPFHLDIRGDEVALTGARVVGKTGDLATVLSPFGDIHVVLGGHADAIRPGMHINVLGTRDPRAPFDTVAAKSAVTLCDAPAATAFALLPTGARRVDLPALNPLRAPLSKLQDQTELAHR